MKMENNELRIEFTKGIGVLVKQGYNTELVSRFAFEFYLNNKTSDKLLDEVVYDIMMMDAGPEFEYSENEIIDLLRDRLNVEII